jgi:hypothetical protein
MDLQAGNAAAAAAAAQRDDTVQRIRDLIFG